MELEAHTRLVSLRAVTDQAAALPRRALAGSAAGKALEALTLAGLVVLVPRALGPADYGGFAVALAVATGIATATGIGGPALFAHVLAPLRRAAARRGAGARAAGGGRPARCSRCWQARPRAGGAARAGLA